MDEIKDQMELAFDNLCNVVMGACASRLQWDEGMIELGMSVIRKHVAEEAKVIFDRIMAGDEDNPIYLATVAGDLAAISVKNYTFGDE
jgi:hypothetical protein